MAKEDAAATMNMKKAMNVAEDMAKGTMKAGAAADTAKAVATRTNRRPWHVASACIRVRRSSRPV